MGKSWLAPLAFLYGTGVTVRHKLFDWGLLRIQKYDFPIVCVGNITVGGTGKTPVTEMLAAHLRGQWNVAVLSRGYGRRTKGYVEVEPDTPFLNVGDEPKQIKLKFPDIVVAVCEKRADGIRQIRERHPEIDLIILDDGFQHRYVEPWVNIVLVDYTHPVYRDHLLPWGRLRDRTSQLRRANFVITTKCPHDMTALDRRIVRKCLSLYPYQNLYFSAMEYGRLRPVFRDEAEADIRAGANIIAMSGIGNPDSFRESLERRYTVVDELVYPDHHPYRRRDLDTMQRLLDDSPEGTVIVTTEKDSVKLRNSRKIPAGLRKKLYYQPLKVSFHENSADDFLNKLDHDIRTNPEDRFLHP